VRGQSPRPAVDASTRREARNCVRPSLHRHPQSGKPMKPELLSRRRPLSPTGAGGVEERSRCAVRFSTRAGPCDAVIDVVRSRRLESRASLLLLPALGLPRALFRRCFRLRLSLLRHAALLAMSEWRLSYSARGDREHSIRITTARQKNQCFRLVKRNCARVDTRYCVVADAEALHRRSTQHHHARPRTDFFDSLKIPMKYGFLASRSLLPQRREQHRRNASAMPNAPCEEALSIPNSL